jgi:hypothetical protein
MKSVLCGGALALVMTASLAHAGDVFMKPTPEELKMTSMPGYPAVPAVVLFREQITKDDLHVIQHYDRIKVLSEEGKRYANVELNYYTVTDAGEDNFYDDKSVGDIVGRTIHPDGTVIPFTGKPYLKVIEKHNEGKFQAKVFTLPDVEVGSIIEYRYETRYQDHAFESPDWYIQGDLYVKAAHYAWYPTLKELVDSKERPINAISWFPILPAGAKIEHTTLPATSNGGAQQIYELTVKDVPPTVDEEYMPPISSFTYRVLFNFTAYRTSEDFWKSEGKEWSKHQDSFANPNGALKDATQKITEGATTQDQKLQKIYAAVMELENTHFTREHERREDKAAGEGKISSAADVLSHKRGTPAQMTELFVGMARAAGMKAYLMLVPDRSERIFTPSWLSFQQFDDIVAIVNVDGKEMFFDPGERDCAYGHLAWQHTIVRGLRQTDNGTDFGQTPEEAYANNRSQRVANLNMDEKGNITGTIDLTYVGSAALAWRQTALRGDDESLKHELRTSLEKMLPKTLEVKVTDIKDLSDYEKPLKVSFDVKGGLGTPTGKRLVLPADLFESSSSATFPHETRENAVYFHYPHAVQDALRINFKQGFEVEAVPSEAKLSLPKRAVYTMTVEPTPTSFTTRRNYTIGDILIIKADYPALRTFYSQFESKDQESVVLKIKPAEAEAAKSVGN